MSQENKLNSGHVISACATGKKEYTIESLIQINESFNLEYGVNESDVIKANAWVEYIESCRSSGIPKPGDRIIYTSGHGNYTGRALVARVDDNGLHICISPMIPFVYKKGDGIGIDASGGPFTHIPVNGPEYKGTVKNGFKDWGHYGACGNGAVVFYAEVSEWEYAEPEPLYGGFTTRDRRKVYISKPGEKGRKESGCLYSGDGFGFRTEEEYQMFLEKTSATVFPGNWDNQLVLWLGKDISVHDILSTMR